MRVVAIIAGGAALGLVAGVVVLLWAAERATEHVLRRFL